MTMLRTVKVTSAATLTVAGIAGCIVFLTGEGLDRAEKWVSIAGVIFSILIGLAGLWLSWSLTRSSRPTDSQRSVRNTGNAVADGRGSRANSGSAGDAEDAGTVSHTGDAEARRGGWANTGRTDEPTP